MAELLSVVSILLQLWSMATSVRTPSSRRKKGVRIRETRWSLGVFTRTVLEEERYDDRD